MIKLLFLLTLLFSTWVVFHELTHVALNDFRVTGVCLFDCNPMLETGLTGKYTPFGVYLSEPVNPIAESEEVAHVSGLGFALIGFVVFKKILEKK